MYITNFATLPNHTKPKILKYHERIGRYLSEKIGIPVLSVDADDEYIFADTEEVRKAVSGMPIWLRMFK